MEQNEKKLWFKAKRFGYGWTPIVWQGWAFLIVCVSVGVEPLVMTSHYYKHVENCAGAATGGPGD